MPKRSARAARALRAADEAVAVKTAAPKAQPAAVSVVGRDDLDLDGNWTSLPEADAEPTDVTDVSVNRHTKKRAAAAEEDVISAKKKKRKKKPQGVTPAGVEGEPAQALSRLVAAWTAEVRAASLAALEAREVTPASEWFAATEVQEALSELPARLDFVAQRPKSQLAAKAASVIVLCPSAERAFAALEEIKEAWQLKTKVVVLAAHGGGKKSDQVARQAKAIESGAPVAVATPGRLQRLLDEDLLDVSGVRLLVLDLSVDRKKRDLLTLPETRRETFGLLRKHLLRLLGSDAGPKLVLCGVGDRGD